MTLKFPLDETLLQQYLTGQLDQETRRTLERAAKENEDIAAQIAAAMLTHTHEAHKEQIAGTRSPLKGIAPHLDQAKLNQQFQDTPQHTKPDNANLRFKLVFMLLPIAFVAGILVGINL